MPERVCSDNRCHGNPEGDRRKIIEKEADYILQVKGNQQGLKEDIALYFEYALFYRNRQAESGCRCSKAEENRCEE